MANVFDTRQLEQHLLHLLLNDKMVARMYMNKVKEDMFVSAPRKFIFLVAQKVLADTGSLLSEVLFEFELKSTIIDGEQSTYRAEWVLIQKAVVADNADALVSALDEALTAQQVAAACRSVGELIQKGDVEAAVSALRESSVMIGTKKNNLPFIDVTNYADRLKLIVDKQINPAKFQGIKTGYETFDAKTGGLFPAELTIFAAVSGVGKSTMIKAIAGNIVATQKKNVLHVTNEESRLQVEMKYDALFSDMPYFNFKRANMSKSDIEAWVNSLEELKKSQYGKLFVKEIPHFDTAMSITQTYYELLQLGHKIDVIVIDYMDHLMPIQKAWGENDERGKVAADCKSLAVSLNLPVVTATQSATIAEAKQDKGKSMSKMDVYGSKRVVHATNMLAYVIQDSRVLEQLRSNGGDRDYEWECDWIWNIQIAKNRDGTNFEFPAQQHVRTGRVVELKRSGGGTTSAKKIASGRLVTPLAVSLEAENAAKAFDEAIAAAAAGASGEEPTKEAKAEEKAVEKTEVVRRAAVVEKKAIKKPHLSEEEQAELAKK